MYRCSAFILFLLLLWARTSYAQVSPCPACPIQPGSPIQWQTPGTFGSFESPYTFPPYPIRSFDPGWNSPDSTWAWSFNGGTVREATPTPSITASPEAWKNTAMPPYTQSRLSSKIRIPLPSGIDPVIRRVGDVLEICW